MLEVATTEADALKAELAQIGVRLAKTEIRAPFAGILGLRRVSEGAFLSPQTRIVTLVQSDPMKLEFAVPERYAARYRPGDSVTFRVEGIEGERRASIYAIEPAVDPATRTVPMRATTPNADGRLLPGAFADVSVAVREVSDALTVPSIAVVPELGGKKLWVLENGAAQPRQVETGIRTGDRVEVTRGLQAGEAVIISGIQILRPGLAVTVAAESRRSRRDAGHRRARHRRLASSVCAVSLYAFSIRRPVAAWVVSIVIVLFGGLAWSVPRACASSRPPIRR